MKRLVLFALAALFPFFAFAVGTATVRVTNAGSVPIVVAGRTLRPSASATVSVSAGEAGVLAASAPDGWGLAAEVAYPSLRNGATYSLRLSPVRGAAPAPVAPAPAPVAPAPAPVAPDPVPVQAVSASVPASASEGMVLVPAGVNEGVDPDFGPYKLVSPGFYMDRTEITLAQWRQVFDWALAHGYRFACSGSGKADDHPVHTVNWYDCAKWCNARSEMEGRNPVYHFRNGVLRDASPNGVYDPDVEAYEANDGYRLPSRDQWTYAARGGRSGTRFPWGDSISRDNANYGASESGLIRKEWDDAEWNPIPSKWTDTVDPYARFDARFRDGEEPFTAPAGTFPPNGYGLTEMVGNVNEWLSDTSDRSVQQEGSVYGGSWWHDAGACRFGAPIVKARSFSDDRLGFRTVRPAGELLRSELSAQPMSAARHPDAENRKDRIHFDEDGWERRDPLESDAERVRRERRQLRNPDDPRAWEEESPSLFGPDRAAPDNRPEQAPRSAPASSPSGETTLGGGFRLSRVSPDRADLVMFLDHGDATMVPNADFSYGKMQFKLQNRTGWHIAACRVRVAFDAGGGMDLVFTDIPPGESRPSSNHFWSLGSSAGENLRKEPFLFPSFVLAARVEGGRVVETADLYERGVSIGFQP